MQPTTAPNRTSAMKRYGPLLAIVVVVAVIVAVAVISRGGDDTEPTASGTATTGGVEPGAGALSWSDAQARGITDQIDWGDRCDTSRGRQAYPSFFAQECYAPFTGDNGGATSPGVTADSIKVVLYLTPETDPVIDFITSAIAVDDTNAQTEQTVRGFIELYERFYETYGRKVDLEVYTGTGSSEDEVAARADAVAIAEKQSFVVLGGPLLTSAFADELAARKVMCIQCTPGQSDDWYIERAPYVWGVGNNPEQGRAHLVEYIGKALAGRDAEYAGDPALRSQPRRFGLVYLTTGTDSEQLADTMGSELRAYGVTLAETLSYASPIDLQTSAPQLIARLKQSGVTTVIFSGDPIAPQPLTRAATAQEYFPEWVAAGALTDTAAFARTYDQRQWAHAFGVSSLAARTAPELSSSYGLYRWYFGEPPPTKTGSPVTIPMVNLFYAAVQGVGPNLTPETFRQALFAAEPTPRAISQPSLSYGDKGIWPKTDYLGIDDATLIWWDPDAEGQDEIFREGRGLYRYVDGGKRYLPGEWPENGTPVFQVAGSVTIYDQPPPGEQVPDYPSPRRSG
ncbi:ABC transporter substrate-binding protein [Rhabdothermincola sediminis]|uniref:ABC transporter substrate-binding protein n=1 Tax=Rhabdothermincola sediminis TaxID=2751370 RepID=UPI001AA05A8F|nr:ABC transporter substrate-binding protein [Rhabdothermincola sediminis]